MAAIAGAMAASEGDPASTAAPTCRKAEVNPVTGHVLCIDPLGAPVAPPPSASEAPCKPDARTTEAWSYGPKCSLKSPARDDNYLRYRATRARFYLCYRTSRYLSAF